MENAIFVLSESNGFIEWLNGINWVQFSAISAVTILFLLLIFLTATFAYYRVRNNRFEESLKLENNTIRIYRLDIGKNQAEQFDLSHISQRKSVSLDEFYSSFPIGEQGKIKDWIGGFIDGKEEEKFLETDIYFSSSKRIGKSFLYLKKNNLSHGLIYLESHPLPKSPRFPLSVVRKSSQDEFGEYLRSTGGDKGYTFCFTVFPLGDHSRGDSKNKKALPRGTSARFLRAVGSFRKGDQKLIQTSDNEMVIATFSFNDITQAIAFALTVSNGAKSLMNRGRRRNEPIYEVKCGVVENRLLSGDRDAILSEARLTALEAFEGKNTILIYKKGESRRYNEKSISQTKEEIERIIAERKISYHYRPVYSLDKKRVVAYMAKAIPVSTQFSNINELKNYAVRAQDEKNVFSALAKNFVPRFVQERPLVSQKLYYPVRVSEIPFIIPVFSRLPYAKEAKLVFIFTDTDLSHAFENMSLDELLDKLHEIKLAGFGIGVSLSGHTLILEQSILKQMSVFIVDFVSSSEGEKLDTEIRSQLHSLVEKLLKYKMPIVASSLKSWSSLELVVGSGIVYISSDVFAPYSEMLLPVNDKNEKRLLAIYK